MTTPADRSVLVGPSILRVPDDEEMFIGETVRGRTISTIADDTNHLLGYKFLRTVQCQVELDGTLDAFPSESDYRIRWTVSPLAKYVWIGFWYFGEKAKGVNSTTIDAELFTYPAGASASATLEWSIENGLEFTGLPMDDLIGWADRRALNYLERQTSTGWTTAGTGTEPRLLDVSAYVGQELELRVSVDHVRLLNIMLVEVYRDLI